MWREDIERMEATRPDMQLGVPTGVPQGVRIGDGLVPEYLGTTDVEERGRQIVKLGRTSA